MTALEFLRMAGDKGRIVSSNDLTHFQIVEARACNRFFIDEETSFGYALLPWELTTDKDRNREADIERDAAQLDRRQLRSDLATARRELGEMKAESERLSTGYECGWCGEEFEDDEGPQSTAHAFCCEHSPVVKRIADLTAKLAEAEKELTLADTATGWWFLFWVFSLTGLTFAFSMYLTWACRG